MTLGRHKNRRRVDAEERGARRKRRLLRAARLGVGAFWAAALLAGGWSVYQWAQLSSYFAIKTVSFHGLRHAAEPELLTLTGLSPGQNIFQLDAEALERAIGTHPWVRSAVVKRHLPQQLEILVSEQVPVAMASLGAVYLLNANGEPFKKAQAGDWADLPMLTGIERDAYMQAPEQTSARFRQALQAIDSFSRATSSPKAISEARLSRLGVTLLTDSGQQIRIGEGDPDGKLKRLAPVLAELERRGLVAEVIRLDNRARPNWVTIKPAIEFAGKAKSTQ